MVGTHDLCVRPRQSETCNGCRDTQSSVRCVKGDSIRCVKGDSIRCVKSYSVVVLTGTDTRPSVPTAVTRLEALRHPSKTPTPHPRGNHPFHREEFLIIHGGIKKFIGTSISFFRSFISFFRTFISRFRGEFSFPRKLLVDSSLEIM